MTLWCFPDRAPTPLSLVSRIIRAFSTALPAASCFTLIIRPILFKTAGSDSVELTKLDISS